jgi:hypothetical protein
MLMSRESINAVALGFIATGIDIRLTLAKMSALLGFCANFFL